MPDTDDRAMVEYLRRSYHAVDGLWFMLLEEDHGFDEALRIDQGVWRVLAKIQARKARELRDAPGNTEEELLRCFSLKLRADGHVFEARVQPGEVRVKVRRCPWQELLQASNRQHLADQVSRAICPAEGQVWCEEFGGEYEFSMPEMMCAGDGHCTMCFARKEGCPAE